MIYKVFISILETFILFGVGAMIWKLRWLEPEDMRRWSRITLQIFFPVLTFSTVLRNFDPARLNEFWIMPLLGFGIMAFGWAAGVPFQRFMKSPGEGRRGAFVHMCAINNYLFLPFIIIGNLWGERELALLLILSVGSTLGFWTVGIFSFGTRRDEDLLKLFGRVLVSPNVLAVAAALAAALIGHHTSMRLPAFLGDSLMAAMTSLGKVAVPFMMVLVGVALARNFGRICSDLYDLALLSVLRLLVLPVLTVLLLRVFGLPEDMYRVALVVSIMPAANASLLMAEQAGCSAGFVGQAIVWTTALSIGSIPLLMKMFL